MDGVKLVLTIYRYREMCWCSMSTSYGETRTVTRTLRWRKSPTGSPRRPNPHNTLRSVSFCFSIAIHQSSTRLSKGALSLISGRTDSFIGPAGPSHRPDRRSSQTPVQCHVIVDGATRWSMVAICEVGTENRPRHEASAANKLLLSGRMVSAFSCLSMFRHYSLRVRRPR
jgi:hypothetical protein